MKWSSSIVCPGFSVVRPAACAMVVLAAGFLGGCDEGASGVRLAGEYPVAYVERALPRDEDTGELEPDDVRDPALFRPGARLMLKEQASPTAPARDIAGRLFTAEQRYDVRDVSASFDGSKLLFALRGPFIEDADEEDQPTWNIWEYDIAADSLRRVIVADIVAEEGHDIMPSYLPDNRILFASTRARATRAILVDEGKPQFAPLDDTLQHETFSLHTMDADGTNIRQITFNSNHDLYPTLLADGRVLFARQARSNGRIAMHLYTVRPDGRDLSPAFGINSHDTVMTGEGEAVTEDDVEFTRPHEMDDGRVLVIERPYETRFFGGALAVLDIGNFSDENQPLAGGLATGGIEDLDGEGYPGEQVAARNGRYLDAVPLADGSGRLLVSWSACRVQRAPDPDAPPPDPEVPVPPPAIHPCEDRDVADEAWEEAAPIYGVFVYDPAGQRRLPVVVPREGMMYESLAVAVPRDIPVHLGDEGINEAWEEEGVGVLDIRSFYDIDGVFDPLGSLFVSIAELADPAVAAAAQRPARFLRLEKAAYIPDDDVRDFDRSAFGVNQGFGMREILGYAPIEPDGSVRVKVPANVPFSFSVVDAAGRRVGSRHAPLVQMIPGETRVCGGCHDADSTLPHGRNDATVPVPLHAGAAAGTVYPNTLSTLIAEEGETMAQLRTRLDPDALTPSVDLRYSDTWTDPVVRAPDVDSALLYADLTTAMPVSEDCQAEWTPLCRTVIHYEVHIHPLWSLDRRVFDVDGVTVLEDNTCTTCHNAMADPDGEADPDTGAVPLLSQLDLRDGISGDAAPRMTAYQELLAQDAEQVIIDGSVVDRLVQDVDENGDPLFETDENGELILDENLEPIPVMVPVNQTPPLVAGAARASTRFFSRFAAGGSHEGMLTPAELRLIAEWVDIGAQYYNDPFAAPLD